MDEYLRGRLAGIEPHRQTLVYDWLREDLRTRNFSGSEHLYDRLVEAGHGRGEALFFKGEIYRLRDDEGDDEKAVAAYTRAIAEQALRRLGAPTAIVAESNQPEVPRAMVELGVGSTVLPVVQAGSELGPGRIIAERTLVLARRDGAAIDPAAELLATLLAAAS